MEGTKFVITLNISYVIMKVTFKLEYKFVKRKEDEYYFKIN